MDSERWRERWESRRRVVDAPRREAPARGGYTGWRDDPDRPGIQRYWADGGWDDTIPPREKPASTWKIARAVALGILLALAAVLVVVWLNQPSDLDCARQAAEKAMGERSAVDSSCEGR